MIPPNSRDVDILARTCYGEARGEGIPGMIAVAWVAINRAKIADATDRRQFGTGSIASACLAPWQFSCWLENDPNRSLLDKITLDAQAFQEAMYAALAAVLGRIADPTQGALFYYASTINPPKWAIGKPYLSIGHHRFLIGDVA